MNSKQSTEIYLQKGKNIRSPGDKLLKITPEQLFLAVQKPDAELKSQINSLRTIRTIDEDKYRRQKVSLPYVTGSIFNPPFRKTENFASAACFILDIDHISANDKNVMELKMRLAEDARIMLLFESPGADGLKIIFRLKEKLYDRAKYSLFYKLFVQKFAAQYAIQNLTDTRTHDVTRACFLSYDADAYYNPEAEPVDATKYINFESPTELKEAKAFIRENEMRDEPPEQDQTRELPEELFAEIKQKLNPKLKIKKEKHIFVPDKLNEILDDIKALFENHGLKLAQVQDIHYGKKLKLEHKQYCAELNLFFGKKGFTVVKTPKKGTNRELTDLAYKLLCDFLY
jgi:hypothetical protein